MESPADSKEQEDWQIQANVYKMLIAQEEDRLAELQGDITHYEAIIGS